MKTMSKDEYFAEGERLFGKDPRKWRFQCVQCKAEQGYDEFAKYASNLAKEKKVADYLGFSCIGRFTKKMVVT